MSTQAPLLCPPCGPEASVSAWLVFHPASPTASRNGVRVGTFFEEIPLGLTPPISRFFSRVRDIRACLAWQRSPIVGPSIFLMSRELCSRVSVA